jgi:hypothetical protein
MSSIRNFPFKQNFHFEIEGLTQFIPNDCVTWELLNEVGKGNYGTVYLVKCTNCTTRSGEGTRILKHVTFKRDFTRENFLEEVRNQRICAKAELCPEVEAVWTSQTDGIMIMEPMHDTVRALLHRHQGNTALQFTIIEKCMELIKRLHTRTFLSHGDTHLYNMMIMNQAQNVEDMRFMFIDMGKTTGLHPNEDFDLEQEIKLTVGQKLSNMEKTDQDYTRFMTDLKVLATDDLQYDPSFMGAILFTDSMISILRKEENE